jgi:hypothetical protein
MYAGLGFLIASLLALIILPFVHARAVRLTTRRIEDAAPISVAEIQADKDQLRAEFAMSTRRLEMSVEQLKGTREKGRSHRQTQSRSGGKKRFRLLARGTRQGDSRSVEGERRRTEPENELAARNRSSTD